MRDDPDNDMIEITVEEYEELLEGARFLEALEEAGVDNWDGYSYAIEILNEMDDD